MSVLARDIDAYQRAVEAYQRQVRGYNDSVYNYNDSFFTDANGNLFAVGTDGAVYTADPATGKLTLSSLPQGKTLADFGLTPSEGNANFLMLRQNPTAASTQTYNDVRVAYPNATEWDQGAPAYYTLNADGTQNFLPLNYRITGTTQVQTGMDYETNQPIYETRYTAAVNNSTYATQPGEFTGKVRASRPDPTAAQLRKLSQPSLVEQERTGLISGDIVQGGGVLSGGLVRNNMTAPPPPPDDPVDPYDPWNPNKPGNDNTVLP